MIKIIEKITYKEDNTIENTTRKIEIPGEINGPTMLAAVMNLQGWKLAIKDRSQNTSLIITGENELELQELQNLLSKTKISIAIQVPLNLPETTPGS